MAIQMQGSVNKMETTSTDALEDTLVTTNPTTTDTDTTTKEYTKRG